jgi:glycosyltransferase involved in cell wall biosynthesis
MKILICVSEYFPQGSGIAHVAYNTVETLKKKGIDCTVCSPVGPDIHIKTYEHYGRFGLLYFWNNVRNYFKKHEKNYDIIWLHNPLFLKTIPFEKCIVTIHTTAVGQITQKNHPIYLYIYRKIAAMIEVYCFKQLNSEKIQFTAITPQIQQEMGEFISQKISIISNGVDTQRFLPPSDRNSIRLKFNIPIDAEVFLFVGRLTEVKRPFEMLKLFKKISDKRKNALLIIAGSGELFNSFSQTIEKEQLKNIKILGFIPYFNLPEVYACADYYWSTSKYEGQPLTLLEAMATGLPCIVPDIPSFAVVKDADCGIMINYLDEDNALDQILNFINKDRTQYSRNARIFAENQLDWQIIAEQYLKLFTAIYSEDHE